ncbi:MAG: AbrB/MazE/SpoVT family DNA-binding domain-containing protein [Firmicutes bacterium]|nr:AbrB/MazE/SpoVT family DNA-binding domain-containing protein [Bacillota bacterium]
MNEQYAVKISDKGQVTLPKKLRERLGLKRGDYLLLSPQGQGLRVEKALVSPVAMFREIAEETEMHFRDEGIRPADVEEAVNWARRQK